MIDHNRSRANEERNPLRVRDEEHPYRGIRGRGAYADRKEANYVGKSVKPAISAADIETIRRQIARGSNTAASGDRPHARGDHAKSCDA